MAKRDLVTKRGFNMFDMSSLLQKSIRRCKLKEAAFAARELYDTYYKYVWKRLLVISAEDCYGVMTKEILALKASDDLVNEGKKPGHRDTIFISKAVTLLCMARKNRDACYVACNLFSLDAPCPFEDIPVLENFDEVTVDHIPDWTYDKHTVIGKKMGRDSVDMVGGEQDALFPLQPSIFDDGNWDVNFQGFKNKEKLWDWQADKKTTDECLEEYFG